MKAKVQCADGKCGKSTYLIVNPVKRAVTHFVVKDKKLPGSSDRLVPVEKIADTSDGLIRLDCTRAEVAAMPSFTVKHYVKGKEGDGDSDSAGDAYVLTQPVVAYDTWEGPLPAERMPPGELAVYRGMDVSTAQGKVGQVDELVVDPDSGEITHLLMRQGHLWGKKDVAIPVTAIDTVEADEVYLNIDKDAVGALPPVPVKRHTD
jgi:sporulation protein YlmC with PRC-barrel domain